MVREQLFSKKENDGKRVEERAENMYQNAWKIIEERIGKESKLRSPANARHITRIGKGTPKWETSTLQPPYVIKNLV